VECSDPCDKAVFLTGRSVRLIDSLSCCDRIDAVKDGPCTDCA
jgi:hypothetical protein